MNLDLPPYFFVEKFLILRKHYTVSELSSLLYFLVQKWKYAQYDLIWLIKVKKICLNLLLLKFLFWGPIVPCLVKQFCNKVFEFVKVHRFMICIGGNLQIFTFFMSFVLGLTFCLGFLFTVSFDDFRDGWIVEKLLETFFPHDKWILLVSLASIVSKYQS